MVVKRFKVLDPMLLRSTHHEPRLWINYRIVKDLVH